MPNVYEKHENDDLKTEENGWVSKPDTIEACQHWAEAKWDFRVFLGPLWRIALPATKNLDMKDPIL